MNSLIFFAFSFALSLLMTMVVRKYALAKNLMDIPNARSSHKKPVPRGGGVAFVGLFFIGIIALKSYFELPNNYFIGLFLPCLIVSVMGFIDDRKGMPALQRFIGHILASAIAIGFIGSLPQVFFGQLHPPAIILFIFSLLYLCWLLNLFNFMDGIDGLAAIEAIFVLVAMAMIYISGGQFLAAKLPLFLAFLVGGFLFWNFPPAKIFMGDVGSGFLGLGLGLLSLIGAQISVLYFFSWLILLGIFITDATFTLFERLLKKEAIWEAHRDHAYQKMAIYFGAHRPVSLKALAINIFWLFPLAFLVSAKLLSPWLGLIIAYLPLIFLIFLIKFSKPIRLYKED